LKAELDRRDGLPPAAATETARGALELATSAEAVAGTLTGAYAMNPARVRESIQPEAWIAATLQNGWANFGATHEGAGYRKTPTGEVQLRGLIKNGTTTNGTTILNLASAYRSAKEREFVSVDASNGAFRIKVAPNGDVSIFGVTNNSYLSLESVRFDV
jgi:hypothetical protein